MPEFLLQRRRALLAAAVALALLLLAVRYVLPAGTTTPAAPLPPPPAPGASATGASAGRVVVDVVGAVRQPGLYRLPQGSLADGEQVVVPKRGAVGAVAPSGAGAGAGTGPAAPVQLSTATLEQLETLPGIGPVMAQKILDFRTKHGAFSSVDELDAVSGIGPKRLDQLRDLVVP